MSDRLMTISELINRLHISRSQFYVLQKRGEIPPQIKIGCKTLFSVSDVDDFIHQRKAA